MSKQLKVNSHLAIFLLASFVLAIGTTYSLDAFLDQSTKRSWNWAELARQAGLAFFCQFGLFLAAVGPMAAHALSGRWSWSVRVLTLVWFFSDLCG